MNSSVPGTNTSAVEVTDISNDGVWLLAHGKELFMSYEDFPWFEGKSAESIRHVEEQSPGHFHWPDIDIDLSVEIIENPEKYPLKAQVSQ